MANLRAMHSAQEWFKYPLTVVCGVYINPVLTTFLRVEMHKAVKSNQQIQSVYKRA